MGKINNCPLDCLTDTGSAIRLVSIEKFKQMEQDQGKIEIVKYLFNVCLADGQPLNVIGQIDGEITLGPLKVINNIIVAEIKSGCNYWNRLPNST